MVDAFSNSLAFENFYATYSRTKITPIIREVLLFEKIAVTYCSYSIFTISSQIKFISFSKNLECYH